MTVSAVITVPRITRSNTPSTASLIVTTADQSLVDDFIGPKAWVLIARACGRIRRQSGDPQPHHAGPAQAALDLANQPRRQPIPAKIRHDADVGDQAEAVRVRRLGDAVCLRDPACHESGQDSVHLRNWKGAAGSRTPPYPCEMVIGDLLSRQ